MRFPFSPSGERALSRPASRNWVWFSIQVALRVLFTVWFRYRAYGFEKLPPRGGALLLINHQSFLDPLLVGLPLSRPVSYLARDSLFAVPIVGWILRNTYVMPIDREAASSASLREMIRRLEIGFLVGIFPEGTRSADGTIGPLKPGFVALVRRTTAPIYPIGIAGAQEAFPRNCFLIRPRRVCVVFGDPLSPAELSDLGRRGREGELLELVRRRITECQERAERLRLECGPPSRC